MLSKPIRVEDDGHTGGEFGGVGEVEGGAGLGGEGDVCGGEGDAFFACGGGDGGGGDGGGGDNVDGCGFLSAVLRYATGNAIASAMVHMNQKALHDIQKHVLLLGIIANDGAVTPVSLLSVSNDWLGWVEVCVLLRILFRFEAIADLVDMGFI